MSTHHENPEKDSRLLSIARNAGAKLLATAATMGSSAFFAVVATRYLGDTGFGMLTFAVSFTAMFSVVGDLGLNMLAVREVAQDPTRSSAYLSTLLGLRLWLGLALLFFTIITLHILGYAGLMQTVTCIVALAAFLNGLSLSIRWVFQAFQRLEYDALLDVLKSVLLLVFGGTILLAGKGVLEIAWLIVGLAFLVLVLAVYLSRRFTTIRYRLNRNVLNNLLLSGYPLAILVISGVISDNIGVVILSKWADPASIGWYGCASRLIVAVNNLPAVLLPALFPVFAVSYLESPAGFQRLLSRCFELTLLVCLTLAMPLTVFAPQIVTWLFGPVFTPAAPVLQVLAWSSVAHYLRQTLGHGLIAAGRQKINSLLCVLGLVIGLTANLLLVPTLLHLGVAWSVLLAEAFLALGSLVVAWKIELLRLEMKVFPRILLLAGAYFALLSLYYSLPFFLWLPLAVAGSLVAAVATGFLTRDEWRLGQALIGHLRTVVLSGCKRPR